MDHQQKAEKDPTYEVAYDPPTLMGTFKAFASIMFAFAGASTFPTIQADVKQKDKFSISAVIACTSKFHNTTYVVFVLDKWHKCCLSQILT